MVRPPHHPPDGDRARAPRARWRDPVALSDLSLASKASLPRPGGSWVSPPPRSGVFWVQGSCSYSSWCPVLALSGGDRDCAGHPDKGKLRVAEPGADATSERYDASGSVDTGSRSRTPNVRLRGDRGYRLDRMLRVGRRVSPERPRPGFSCPSWGDVPSSKP